MWTPHLGEKLETQKELDNDHDQFAVTVIKEKQMGGGAQSYGDFKDFAGT